MLIWTKLLWTERYYKAKWTNSSAEVSWGNVFPVQLKEPLHKFATIIIKWEVTLRRITHFPQCCLHRDLPVHLPDSTSRYRLYFLVLRGSSTQKPWLSRPNSSGLGCDLGTNRSQSILVGFSRDRDKHATVYLLSLITDQHLSPHRWPKISLHTFPTHELYHPGKYCSHKAQLSHFTL